MTFAEYQTGALRTESATPIMYVVDSNMRLLHAAMGMVTESMEYMKDSNIDELGDFAWYLAIGYDSIDCAFRLPDVTEDMPIGYSMLKYSIDLLDMLKKNIFYKKPMRDILEHLDMLAVCLVLAIKSKGVSIDEVLTKNLQKLRVRYPQKFESVLAINRQLELEQNVYTGTADD